MPSCHLSTFSFRREKVDNFSLNFFQVEFKEDLIEEDEIVDVSSEDEEEIEEKENQKLSAEAGDEIKGDSDKVKAEKEQGESCELVLTLKNTWFYTLLFINKHVAST